MSRRLTALALGVLALAAAPVVAGASHSDGNGPENDFATGTAIRTAVLPNGSDTRVMMGVSARSGPSGENARGVSSSSARPTRRWRDGPTSIFRAG